MSEAYNFTVNLTSARGHKISIDPSAKYGCFEQPSGAEGGGLWFDATEDDSGKLELIDYDGVAVIHPAIVKALRDAGYVVGIDFD